MSRYCRTQWGCRWRSLSRLAEAVIVFRINVVKIVNLVDCHVKILQCHARSIGLIEAVPTVASSKNRSFFRRDDPFFALQMVNFSFQHDKGRLNDALHQFHSIELVNALRMGDHVVSGLIFILNFSGILSQGVAPTLGGFGLQLVCPT